MIKNILVFVVLMICSGSSIAQEYYVLQVKGTVRNERTGQRLVAKESIRQTDRLIFSSESDVVAVVNGKSGRFMIKPKQSKGSSELMAIVKDVLIPGSNRLSTRSGNFNTVHDIQTHFNDSLLFLSELKYKVGAHYFPISATSFFFVRYQYGDEVINKKLMYSSDSLIIKRADLYTVDGKPIKPSEAYEQKLFYTKDKALTEITILKLSAPDLKRLSDEVRVLKTNLQGVGSIKDELIGYLQDTYGKVNIADFEKWYSGERK